MAILQISYSELSKASRQANKSAKQLESYSSSLATGIARKISSVSGGVSELTQNALSLTNEKINKLNEKATKLYDFSKKIDAFKEKVRETDDSVAQTINAQSDIFARNNNVRKGILYTILQGIITEKIDQHPLKAWVKNAYYKAKNKFNDFKTDIKRWWRTGGGKYALDILWSAVFLGAAIVTIFTVGHIFFVVAAIIGAVISGFNLLSNIYNTIRASESSKYSPTLAYKYGKTDTLADTFRIQGWDGLATFVTVLEVGSGIVLAGESLLKGFKGLFSKSKAIKKFFGRSRGLGKKFLANGLNDKTKINVLNGLKSTFTDKKFMNNLVKEFKNNFGQDIKKIIKFIKYQPKRFKQMGLKGITKRLFKNTIKQYTDAFSKAYKFDGTSTVFDFKLPEKALKILKPLNMAKVIKDTVTGLLDKKIKIKYYDNIIKIVKGIKDISSEFNVETVN